MRVLRLLGSIALWIGACIGALAGGVWTAGQLGLVQPLIVISGSMEPGIQTGDLIIDRPVHTAELEVGNIVSLTSALTGKLVTHRIVSITPHPDDATWTIEMKGDANDEADLETYVVGDEVLTPFFGVPHGGTVVSKVMEPAVALPILLALVALLGLSLLDEEPRKVVRRVIRRVTQRDPRVDELDLDLAAVGVDVLRLQQMDDLDLQLYALGIDVAADASADAPEIDAASDDTRLAARNDRGFEDGLWDFQLPASDGIGIVHMPADASPTAHPTPTHGIEPIQVGQPTPARSG